MTATRLSGALPQNPLQPTDRALGAPDKNDLSDASLKYWAGVMGTPQSVARIKAFAANLEQRGLDLATSNPLEASRIFGCLGKFWTFTLRRRDGEVADAQYNEASDNAWRLAKVLADGGEIQFEQAEAPGNLKISVKEPDFTPAPPPRQVIKIAARTSNAPPPMEGAAPKRIKGTDALRREAESVKTNWLKYAEAAGKTYEQHPLISASFPDYIDYTTHLEREAAQADKDNKPDFAKEIREEIVAVWNFARKNPRFDDEAHAAGAQRNWETAVAVLAPPPAPEVKKQVNEGGDTDDKAIREKVLGTLVTDASTVHWEDIAGMDATKREIRQAVVIPRILKELYRKRNKARGVMLYGPSGTGKTMLIKGLVSLLTEMARREEAKATAALEQTANSDSGSVGAPSVVDAPAHPISSINLFCVTGADVNDKYVGQGEKFIKTLFAVAKEMAPSLIFFDEVEALLRDRSQMQNGASHQVFTQFLQAADGFQGRGDVLLLAATNAPWLLDNAATRRFNRPIYVRLPSAEGRASILAKKLEHYVSDITPEQLRDLAENYMDEFSGSDIEGVVSLAFDSGPMSRLTEAQYFVVRDGEIHPSPVWVEGCQHCPIDEVFKGDLEFADLPITFADLAAACEDTRPSNDVQIDQFDKYAEALTSKQSQLKDKAHRSLPAAGSASEGEGSASKAEASQFDAAVAEVVEQVNAASEKLAGAKAVEHHSHNATPDVAQGTHARHKVAI